jgi:hypothetical protein
MCPIKHEELHFSPVSFDLQTGKFTQPQKKQEVETQRRMESEIVLTNIGGSGNFLTPCYGKKQQTLDPK